MKLYRKPALGRRNNPELEDIGAKIFGKRGRKRKNRRQKRAEKKKHHPHGHHNPQKSKKPATSYKNYIKSEAWAEKREYALDYFGRFCMVCGTADQLQVHHKCYRNLGREDVHDLEVLCRGCHGNRHEGQVPGAYDDFTREYLKIIR